MIVLAGTWRLEINGGLPFCYCVRQKCRRDKCDQYAGPLHVEARLVTALANAKQKNPGGTKAISKKLRNQRSFLQPFPKRL
jgi:hypothetical protein